MWCAAHVYVCVFANPWISGIPCLFRSKHRDALPKTPLTVLPCTLSAFAQNLFTKHLKVIQEFPLRARFSVNKIGAFFEPFPLSLSLHPLCFSLFYFFEQFIHSKAKLSAILFEVSGYSVCVDLFDLACALNLLYLVYLYIHRAINRAS